MSPPPQPIAKVSSDEVLGELRSTLGLPPESAPQLDEPLLGTLVRYGAGILCPCSQSRLSAGLAECLQHLGIASDELRNRVDSAIEGLIIRGELLEVRGDETDEWEGGAMRLILAPPRFVVRPSGSIFVLGAVPDHAAFLPRPLAQGIRHDGYLRVLDPIPNRDLRKELRAHGVQELRNAQWLAAPQEISFDALIKSIEGRLDAQPLAGEFGSIQILDSSRPVKYYPGRWKTPRGESGVFVARRPQEYGSPLWCVARLETGSVRRFVDLPMNDVRSRACDEAWHLQTAYDRRRGVPQRYRLRRNGGRVRFDFFSPLPQWAERRLLAIGQQIPPSGCLISYSLPDAEAAAEEQFIQNRLWLARSAASKA